jgi:hypothetical protein
MQKQTLMAGDNRLLRILFGKVVEREFFKGVSQIPKQREILIILIIEYIHRTRQLCKYKHNVIKV